MVSVIIPCFNQGRYLPEALESVIRQTWADWECIVVNDGSTDDTREVALRFTRRDPRIRYLEKRNGGLSDARNHGLDAARGDLIQFLDADDALLPRKLEAQIEAMRPAEGPVIATCDYFRGAPEDVLREVNGPRHSPRFLTDQHLDELILRFINSCDISKSYTIRWILIDAASTATANAHQSASHPAARHPPVHPHVEANQQDGRSKTKQNQPKRASPGFNRFRTNFDPV